MIFHNNDGKLQKLNFLSIDREKVLQKLIEENLLEVLDISFLASEYLTTSGGRIDTLGIDGSGAPVIIEYKRNKNDNVINQSLSYLKWLKSQKEEFFQMLVAKTLGQERADNIDWKNPRVICIAESYNRFDIDTLDFIAGKLELYKYQYYENETFTLENVKGEEKQLRYIEPDIKSKLFIKADEKPTEPGLDIHLNKSELFVRELFFDLQERILLLDENIQRKINSNYISYKVSKIFAEVHLQKNKILIYLRPIDYNDIRVSKVPDTHNWTLDRRLYLNNNSEMDFVITMIEKSYNDVL